jgi:hypothetical protein
VQGLVRMTTFAGMTQRWWAVGRPLMIALALAITLLAAAQPAMADKRVALVIGNSTYQHAKGTEGAAGGARVIGAALQSAGFTLAGGAVLIDLDKASLDRAIQDFGRQIADADVALVYYAGHAIQLRSSNFLVPVRARRAMSMPRCCMSVCCCISWKDRRSGSIWWCSMPATTIHSRATA